MLQHVWTESILYSPSTSLRFASAVKLPWCVWTLTGLNEWWGKALYPFHLSSCFLSLSTSRKKEKLFTASCSAPCLAVSHSPPPLLICLESVRMWMQRRRVDLYPAVPAGFSSSVNSIFLSPPALHPLTMLVCHQVSSLVTFSSSLYPTLRPGLSLVLADTQLTQSLN